MFQVKELPRGPTTSEYEQVRKVFKDTGILTVKDKVTGKWTAPSARCGGIAWEVPYQDTIEYGAMRQQRGATEAGGAVPAGFSAETFLVRATYVRFVGTKRFPGGLAIGGYEVWTQDKFFEDTDKYSCVNFRADIWTEEMDTLKHYAEERPHVTDEMWQKAEEEARARHDHKLVTQQDPAGALIKALTEAVASQATARGLPPSVLAEIERLKAENERLKASAK
jgi:hypothetical protein